MVYSANGKSFFETNGSDDLSDDQILDRVIRFTEENATDAHAAADLLSSYIAVGIALGKRLDLSWWQRVQLAWKFYKKTGESL